MANYTLKDYARQVSLGYSSAISRLQKKYNVMMGALDNEFVVNGRQIDEENEKAKNEASATHKIDLANARRSLLDRGLASSGESVNTEIRSNLSKNRALAALDAAAAKAHSENALNRSIKKGELIASRLKEESTLENEKLEKALDQMNLDIDRDEDKRRFDIESEQKKLDDYRDYKLNERKQLADESYKYFEKLLAKKKFESSEEQRKIENELNEKKYNLSAYDVSAKHADSSGSANNVQSGDADTAGSGTAVTTESVDPEFSAADLVNKMYNVYYVQCDSESDIKKKMKESVKTILDDENISSDYREQVRIYATALGYID